METGMITADDQGRKRGETFVQSLRPVGGTNINQALLSSMQQFTASNRPKIVVFLTDGLPTVGVTNITRIEENARQARIPGLRLFTFGVGYDVNTALLDKLAADNGGVADYIEPKEDLEVKISNFFAKINYPVLTDLKLDMAGLQTDLVYPRSLPDLFKGTQLTLIGRYKNPIDMEYVRLTLTGTSSGKIRTVYFNNLRFPLREERNDFLPRLWATRRVGWLMEQVRANGENKELRDEIVDLGTRYGIVTPYTSYLALEPGAQPQETVTVTGSGGQIDSMARLSPGVAPAPPKAADARANTGMAGVQQSKRARVQSEAVKVDKDEVSSAVKRAKGKTFYLRERVWTDSEFKAEARLPETAVTFGSDEYFALLKQKPALAQFFSLGERLVVVLDGRVYRVNGSKP